jgi:hypothetical protein
MLVLRKWAFERPRDRFVSEERRIDIANAGIEDDDTDHSDAAQRRGGDRITPLGHAAATVGQLLCGQWLAAADHVPTGDAALWHVEMAEGRAGHGDAEAADVLRDVDAVEQFGERSGERRFGLERHRYDQPRRLGDRGREPRKQIALSDAGFSERVRHPSVPDSLQCGAATVRDDQEVDLAAIVERGARQLLFDRRDRGTAVESLLGRFDRSGGLIAQAGEGDRELRVEREDFQCARDDIGPRFALVSDHRVGGEQDPLSELLRHYERHLKLRLSDRPFLKAWLLRFASRATALDARAPDACRWSEEKRPTSGPSRPPSVRSGRPSFWAAWAYGWGGTSIRPWVMLSLSRPPRR